MSLIRLLLLVVVLATGSAANAEWRRAESPNFVVFSEESDEGVRSRILQLEDFHWLLGVATSARAETSPNKLHVYVVDNREDLNAINRVGEGIEGYYTASSEGILAVVNSRARNAEKNEVLFHEYAHHFMMQYAPAAYPGWYIEGFAEYFGTAKLSAQRVDIGLFSPGRVYSVAQGPWLPLERMLSGGPDGLDEEAISAYYAQAWLMTHFFYSTPERQAMLRRYLAADKGTNPIAALEAATGMNADAFTSQLRRYIGGGSLPYRRMTRTASAPPSVTITRLPASANDLLVHSAALQSGLGADEAPARLGLIRAAAAKHPNDAFARRTLAHAELLHGDRKAALGLLEALQAEAPNDAQLMYLRGRLHLENAENGEGGDDVEQEIKAAQTWFGRAHRIDENHFQTLYRFAQSHRYGQSAASENTLNVLLLAQQLAPQVVEVRMNAASLLIRRGDVELAEYMLRPLLFDPHNRGLAREARRMIERARRSEPAHETAEEAAEATD